MNKHIPGIFALAVVVLVAGRALATAGEEVSGVIRAAGNAHEEKERFGLLQQLQRRTDLDAALRADLEKLLPVVDAWANGKDRGVNDPSRAAENGYLCRFISGKVKPTGEGAIYPPAVSDGSPLRPIWAYYRARMLIWRVVQVGGLMRVEAARSRYYAEARQLLEEARKAFPENRIIGMYLGTPIPWPRKIAVSAEAPEWANVQREGLEKLADIIHWWIAERQLEDGQFGGGWGDDVEMWRWWTPLLIGFEDPVINAAQERISSGIFRQPHLKEGFTSRMTDVEHSNEDTTDTILPMMHLKPDDPVWRERALRLAELMRDRWTGRNQRGFLQFKSIYFSVDKVDEKPERAFDTVYHASIVQPTLLYWQRTGDAGLGKLFGEWLKVWIDAAARAENGKPAGVLPSVIQWPAGTVGGPDKPWWEPFSPAHNDALYNWPGATRLMSSTLLLAYQMTRDEQYLAPIRSMAAIRQRHARKGGGEAGSEAWCAGKMSSFLADTLAKYRLLTGDKAYDKLLLSDASGYIKYRLGGDTAALTSSLRRNAEAFAVNWEAFTSEMRWTDRVMNFTGHYLQHLPQRAAPTPAVESLYTSVTGDVGNPLILPLNAVRWLTPPREIAALVTDSGPARLEAELFHFGTGERSMGTEMYLLKAGEYVVSLVEKRSGKQIGTQALSVKGPRATVRFALPAGRLCVLRVEAKG